MMNPEGSFSTIKSIPTTTTQECLYQKRDSVAARLRGLWAIAPWAGEHTRLSVNKLKTQEWKLHLHI